MSSGDPKLGPLASNGGLTQTHALLPGSVAIDACDPVIFESVHQRAVSRPIDGDGNAMAICDIGAYEAPRVGNGGGGGGDNDNHGDNEDHGDNGGDNDNDDDNDNF